MKTGRLYRGDVYFEKNTCSILLLEDIAPAAFPGHWVRILKTVINPNTKEVASSLILTVSLCYLIDHSREFEMEYYNLENHLKNK